MTEQISTEKDWDMMREILMDVEKFCLLSSGNVEYVLNEADHQKFCQALILYEKKFIQGVYVISCEGRGLTAYGLTREGRELLGSMRNQPVWIGIKKLAQQKSVELSVCTIRHLSTFALKTAFMNPKHFN